jgi:hypothetical protein
MMDANVRVEILKGGSRFALDDFIEDIIEGIKALGIVHNITAILTWQEHFGKNRVAPQSFKELQSREGILLASNNAIEQFVNFCTVKYFTYSCLAEVADESVFADAPFAARYRGEKSVNSIKASIIAHDVLTVNVREHKVIHC